MATLVENKDKVWQQKPGEDFIIFMDRGYAELKRLQEAGVVISFPHADGQAHYEIVSEKPLKLKPLPVGDAWEVLYSQIRGLRLADVKDMLHRVKASKKLCSNNA
jgi:hypothetical protein